MPYLQLDTPFAHTVAVKKRLAERLGATYAAIMEADARRVSVAIRDLGAGGLWRCTGDEAYPAALLMLDIRRGRPVEQRMRAAAALIAICREDLGLRADQLNVEFTQHAADEMVHPMLGDIGGEWQPTADEATVTPREG